MENKYYLVEKWSVNFIGSLTYKPKGIIIAKNITEANKKLKELYKNSDNYRLHQIKDIYQ